MLHLLHLSDIHLGTVGDALTYRIQLEADLTRELAIGKLDYLVVSGDITEHATPDEYAAAYELLGGLAERFGPDPGHIVIVPGVHDVNADESKRAYNFVYKDDLKNVPESLIIPAGDLGSLLRDDARYPRRFANFNSCLYQRCVGSDYPLDPVCQGGVYLQPEDHLLIISLNSCWEIDHYYRQRAGINPEALARALDQVSDTRYSDWLKVAVWHHPVTGRDGMDDEFLQRLAAHGFQLCLHGCVHQAGEGQFHYTRYGLQVIGAGAFGAPASGQAPGVPMQYNLLELDPLRHSVTVKTRRKETPLGAWSADARWGDPGAPAPRYTLNVRWDIERPGTDQRQWTVFVPAGSFPLGTDRYDNERPMRDVWLNSFYIGRFPVTNAQYRAFIDGAGYLEQRYWTAAGWAWAQRCQRRQPMLGLGTSDHPVQYITWHEAVAFTRWLAEATRLPYRLPTEAEWEKAACWDSRMQHKREYPWGDEFDLRRCNVKTFGTTPVGAHPDGASPYEALDMAGNVWEWTSSLRWAYPYLPDDGRENPDADGERVIRGGCWATDEGYARSSGRYAANQPVWPTMNTEANYSGPIGLRVALTALAPVHAVEAGQEPAGQEPAGQAVQAAPKPGARIRLHEVLDTRFNDAELRVLCYDLAIDYENLRGGTKMEKAMELVAYFERRGRIQELIQAGRRLRDDIAWDNAIP